MLVARGRGVVIVVIVALAVLVALGAGRGEPLPSTQQTAGARDSRGRSRGDILTIKQEQLALCKLLLFWQLCTHAYRIKMPSLLSIYWRLYYQSKASGFNKKSVSEIVRIPSSSCHGTTGAFCIKMRLKPSLILRKDCVSCLRFSPVGISKADWI